MTNARVERLLKSGSNNQEFLNDIEKADGDKKPGFFADKIEKVLFSSIYYGWLVGKYGDDWEHHL